MFGLKKENVLINVSIYNRFITVYKVSCKLSTLKQSADLNISIWQKLVSFSQIFSQHFYLPCKFADCAVLQQWEKNYLF